MTRTTFLMTVAVAAFSLIACSQQEALVADSDNGAAAPASIQAAALGSAVQAGLWETTTTSAGAEPEVTRSCLTEEDVGIDNMLAEMARAEDENCTFTKRQIGGGRFELQSQCRMPDGSSMQSHMKGAYSPTTVQYALTMKGAMNGAPMDVSWAVKGRRIAAVCPADET